MKILSRLPASVRVVALALGCAVAGAGAAEDAVAPVRVVSQTVGSDELLLALAEPEQIAALSHIARDPAYSVVAAEAKKFPQITQGDAETILKHWK